MSRPETPSDPPRRFLILPEGRVSYTDVGRGRCFLALHGMPGSVRDFRWLGARLEADARLLRFDLPGFGETPIATDRAVALEDRAAFVIRAMTALELTDVCLIGHSLGGALALAVAALAPQRVVALGLIASIGLTPHRGYRQLGPGSRLAGRLLGTPVVGRLILPVARPMFRRAGFRGFSDEALRQTMRCVLAVDFATHRRFAADVRVPTLLAWSQDDPMIEPAIPEALGSALPDGPRLDLPSGRHLPQKDHADAIADALLAFGV